MKAEKAEAARAAKAAKKSKGSGGAGAGAATRTQGSTSAEDATVAVAVAASTQASADAAEAEEAATCAGLEADLAAAAYLEAHKFATKEVAEAHVAREAQEHAELKAAEATARVAAAAEGEDKASAEAEAEAAAATAAAAKATAEREQTEADAAVALQDQASERAAAAEATRQAKVDAKEAKSQVAQEKVDAVLRAQDKRTRLIKKHLVEADEEVVDGSNGNDNGGVNKSTSGMCGCFGGTSKATASNGLSKEELRAAADAASPSFGVAFSLLLPAVKAKAGLTDASNEKHAVSNRVVSVLASSLGVEASQVALGDVWRCSNVVIVDVDVGGLGDRHDAELLLTGLEKAVADGALSSEARLVGSHVLSTIVEESESYRDGASRSPSLQDASGRGAEEEKVQASDENSTAAAVGVREDGIEQEVSTAAIFGSATAENSTVEDLLARCELEVPPYVIRSQMPLSAAAVEARAKLAADAAAAAEAAAAEEAAAAAREVAAAAAAAAAAAKQKEEDAAAAAAANAKALESAVTEAVEEPPQPEVAITNTAPEVVSTASGPDEPSSPAEDPTAIEAARRAAEEALRTAEAQLADVTKQQEAAEAALFATANSVAVKRKELDDLELRCSAAERSALAAEAANAKRAAVTSPIELPASPTAPVTPSRGGNGGISRAALDAAAADLSAALTPHKLAGALTVLPHTSLQSQAPSRSAVTLHRIHVADAVPAPPPFHGAPPRSPYGSSPAAPSSLSPQQHYSGNPRDRSSWVTHVDDAGDSSNLGAAGGNSNNGYLSPQPRSAGSFRRRGGAVPLAVPPPPPLFGNHSSSSRSPYKPPSGAMNGPVNITGHMKGINQASHSDERGPVENWRWVNDRDAYVR